MRSAVAAPGALEHRLIVVLHRLSCCTAYRIFLDQGSNLYPLTFMDLILHTVKVQRAICPVVVCQPTWSRG